MVSVCLLLGDERLWAHLVIALLMSGFVLKLLHDANTQYVTFRHKWLRDNYKQPKFRTLLIRDAEFSPEISDCSVRASPVFCFFLFFFFLFFFFFFSFSSPPPPPPL
jgi:hypothetical protein